MSKFELSRPFFRPLALVRHRLRRALVRLEWLALWVWRRLMIRTTVIAVTGSVGKTTARTALTAILEQRGIAPHHTLSTYANENDEFGVPRTLRRLRPWHRYAVIEIGTGRPGTIRRLGRIVGPDVALILSVARTHTNVFRDLEATAREKGSLLDCLTRRGTAVLNADDPRVAAMTVPAGRRTVWFGTGAAAEVRADQVEAAWPARLSFTVRADGEDTRVATRLVGAHWVPSLLGALSAARACGVPVSTAAAPLADVAPFASRMQPVMLPSGAVVIRDEFNGSPDTLDAMLAVMRDARAERTVLVFSDVSDSRQKPKQRLRRLGAQVAGLADLAVFVGGHAHHAVHGAVSAGMSAAACHDVVSLEDAAALLKRELRAGDLVFVKGRATDHLSRIVFAQLGEIGCWRLQCTVRRPCEFCHRLQPAFDLGAALTAPVPAQPLRIAAA